MILLTVSDFHLGRGKFLENGHLNTLEDFDQDEKFVEFLDHYSTGSYYFTHVNLILNGDILNLIQLDVDGEYTHLLTEEHVGKMVQSIISGHPQFFLGLKRFLSRPNKKVTYVFGNHDFGMVFPLSQKLFCDAVAGEVEFTHKFFEYGVHIEHGHRFEKINSSPRTKQTIPGPGGMPILNLPWASLFCVYLLPKLKEQRPHIDNVRPVSLYVWWTLIHDFRFFVYLIWVVLLYIIRTQFPPYGRYNKNFRIGLRDLLGITIHPKYEKYARRVFRKDDNIKVVVMGHTHIAQWRKYKGDRQYFNCGTWNHVPSLDKALHKNIMELHYVCIEINEKKNEIKNAYLNVWQGKWRPFLEEVAVSKFLKD